MDMLDIQLIIPGSSFNMIDSPDIGQPEDAQSDRKVTWHYSTKTIKSKMNIYTFHFIFRESANTIIVLLLQLKHFQQC